MRSMAVFLAITVFVALSVCCGGTAGADRMTVDLSEAEWSLWRDIAAQWIDDDIRLPPVDVASLPVNPPSCGWDDLADNTERIVHIPATVEEYFWGDNGSDGGVSGDYRGVSWWTTTVDLGPKYKDRRLYLDFASVHLRAEVFVNRTLAGYDAIGHTPFSVDITGFVVEGENEIAVRITDPVGNFSWNDRAALSWGGRSIPAVHGFGGITGPVVLRAVDDVHIGDLWVLNTPDITTADIHAHIVNLSGESVSGTLAVTVTPRGDPETVVWRGSTVCTIPPEGSEYTLVASPEHPAVWDIDNPALYYAVAEFRTDDGVMHDTMRRRFGFRWFDVREENGDQRLFLNGGRIVLRGAMSWGFWPLNGVYATREMAKKDVATAKSLGITYMNYHRAIGQPAAMDAADEMGLLTYEEPGGYSCEDADPDDDLWSRWRREKFLRMVRRDRSRPSLIIYNLQNRTPNPPTDEDRTNMRDARELDPSRILTFISGFWKKPPEVSPDKLFWLPYDEIPRETGWFDMHNHTPEFGYADRFYNAPDDYLRFTGNSREVVFWGEDGGIYGPPRLQLIRDYHEMSGCPDGWLGARFRNWYEAWDDFLDRSRFRRFFPDVDAFTTALGNVTLDYHGRIIENIRAGNLDDCYTVNGWAAPHLVNQGEIADLYRNPVGDPAILARYCRNRHIAVKLRETVAPVGGTVVVDIYLIDETGLTGGHTLDLDFTDPDGGTVFRCSISFDLPGDGEYGRLLTEALEIPVGGTRGAYLLVASLTDGGGISVADGADEVFAVDLSADGVSDRGAVIDTTGVVNAFLTRIAGFDLPDYGDGRSRDYVVLGPGTDYDRAFTAELLDRVADGMVAVVLTGADRLAGALDGGTYEALEYQGVMTIGKGNFIAGGHAFLLDGLPEATAFDHVYQAFYSGPGKSRQALLIEGAETVVAAVSGGEFDVGTALAVVSYGRGHIVLSTLELPPLLGDDAPQSLVGKHLFLNMLRFASAGHGE